ncbi:MAG: SGNH/GDSL hydrolase family protein [Gallionellaceae bacterium]|nr:SGNH/GDSL hydrolase family protein [Gallionellaceae bacterium]
MRLSRPYLLVLAFTALIVSNQASATITRMVVFGDSLSDSGNLYNITGGAVPTSPPYAQRFSNGPVAVEYLAGDLGVALAPSTIGGGNYAVAGAATGGVATGSGTYDSYVAYAYPALAGLNSLTGMDKQLAAYLGTSPSGLSDTLFVLWGGSNDLFIAPTSATMSQAVVNLSNEISALIGIGASQFLIPDMADWSLTPEGQASSAGTRAYMSALNAQFNSELAAALASLGSANPGVDITSFDTNTLFQDIYGNAAAYGFNYTTTSCVGDGCYTTAGLADQYMFWDNVHPSARLNQIVGNAFAKAVPEPGILLLLCAGLLPLYWIHRPIARREPLFAA